MQQNSWCFFTKRYRNESNYYQADFDMSTARHSAHKISLICDSQSPSSKLNQRAEVTVVTATVILSDKRRRSQLFWSSQIGIIARETESSISKPTIGDRDILVCGVLSSSSRNRNRKEVGNR